jgi:transcriptional regulator with XRE-family HTH domain
LGKAKLIIFAKMDDHPPVATLRAVLLRWVRDRLKAGETQERVASRLGLTRTQLNQIISGYVPKVSKRPRTFTIRNIDKAAHSFDGGTLGSFLHRLGEIATEIDTEERIVAHPVDEDGARALADEGTAERVRQLVEPGRQKPPKKPR